MRGVVKYSQKLRRNEEAINEMVIFQKYLHRQRV